MIISLATDPNWSTVVIQQGGGSCSKSRAFENIAMILPSSLSNAESVVDNKNQYEDTHNPSFDKALKIQQHAYKYLANKQ